MKGITRHGQSWRADEDDYIRENYAALGGRACAEHLRRSHEAVRHRACILGVTIPMHPSKRPPLSLIKELAEHYAPIAKCKVRDIFTTDKRRHVSWARWQMFRDLRAKNYSLPGIAFAMGLKDHTSVVHGLTRADISPPKPTHRLKPKPRRQSAFTATPPANVIPFPVKVVIPEPCFIAPPSKARLMAGR